MLRHEKYKSTPNGSWTTTRRTGGFREKQGSRSKTGRLVSGHGRRTNSIPGDRSMENTTEALEQLLARIGCQVESTPETQTTATRPVDKRRLRLCKPLAK